MTWLITFCLSPVIERVLTLLPEEDETMKANVLYMLCSATFAEGDHAGAKKMIVQAQSHLEKYGCWEDCTVVKSVAEASMISIRCDLLSPLLFRICRHK